MIYHMAISMQLAAHSECSNHDYYSYIPLNYPHALIKYYIIIHRSASTICQECVDHKCVSYDRFLTKCQN